MKIESPSDLVTGLYEEYDYPLDWRLVRKGKYYDNNNQRVVVHVNYILIHWCYYNISFKKYLL